MFGFRHPRISSALLVALVWGAGYLIGANAQRGQAPEQVAAPRLENGSAAETPTLDLKPDFAWAPDSYADLPRGCVLVHGGSDHVVDQGGVPILPPDFVAGVFASSGVDQALASAGGPGPCSAEFPLLSEEGFY